VVFLTDDLSNPGSYGENSGHNPGTDALSYMGICRLSREGSFFRRIDIKAYPGCQGAFAKLYFTGDAYFNRSMRAFAKRAGLTLSDAGLARAERQRMGDKTVKIKVFPSVSCSSEEQVFTAMGIPFVPPEYRICTNNTGRIGNNNLKKAEVVKRWDDNITTGDESDFDDF